MNYKIEENLNVWYLTNNIIYEKNELYYCFFNSLFTNINDTYLGSDVIKTNKIITEHFNWCFLKTIDDFEKENIFIKSNGSLYEYMIQLFKNTYYVDSSEKKISDIYVIFNNLFDFYRDKTNKELDMYKYIYKIFEVNLKN